MKTTRDDFHPETIEPSGQPPETRIGSANQARAIYERLWRSDLMSRSPKRALVKGLVDGNPPYRQRDLDNAGRSHQCNINFRTAESYLENAVGAFYDTHNEASTFAQIKLKTSYGTPEKIKYWSDCVTLNFDWLLRCEDSFDYNVQVSQGDMVLFGKGPMVFQDVFDWRPTSLGSDQLYLPERTRSDTAYWEYAAVTMEYLADELWCRIRNEKEAAMLGWNVERVKQAIILASPESAKGGMWRSWEWHQQQLKNGAIDYTASCNTISVVHVFCREFAKAGEEEGKITHTMVVRNTSGTDQSDTFLFQKIGRFENWKQCIHPMYYDRGGGGFHHSVIGLGIKMYSVFELQNRTLCNGADKVFAPKTLFKAMNSSAKEDFSIEQHAEYGVVTEGFEVQQTPIAGYAEEVFAFNRELSNLASSNLSSYRTNLTEPTRGNPETATKVQLDASKEAALQKTQLTRYLLQKDSLYTEMFRRASNTTSATSPGGKRAMEFLERCKKAGVPLAAMKDPEWVKATRTVGQGSEFLRQQSVEFLFGTVTPTLPESGRANLIKDVIASRAGKDAVERYYPEQEASRLPDDQYAWAMGQVADMKIGVPAVVTDSQNPAIFAQTFVDAADQAVQTLEQGANPMEVASFLDLAGQAIGAHLQRMSGDKTRAALVKDLTEKWKQLAQIHDQLIQQIQRQQEQQQKEAQRRQQEQAAMQSDFALAKQRQDFELSLKAEKTRAGILDKNIKTRAGLAMTDAKTAQGIRLKNIQAEHDRMMAELEAAHSRKMDLLSQRNGDGE